MAVTRKIVPFLWVFAGALGMGSVLLGAPGDDEPPAQDPQRQPHVKETIVVTASRTEQEIQKSPAAMTVLTELELETSPADDYGDLLRNVPGLNVSQLSARDIQVSGRQATGNLTNSGLVLVDGRTLYLDFLGFVIWDFLPLSPREVKQVEVVRGPGSAVWGANAMTGVINVITKSPREMAGTSLTLGGGELSTRYGHLSHAGVRGPVGYKVSTSFYEQNPYERPIGPIPGSNLTFPDFANQGTEQPKIDLRLDYDVDPQTTWSFSGGFSGTDGIIHSGLGPFDIRSGSALSYFRAGWTRRAMQVSAFGNFLDGKADNLLSMGTGGLPLLLDFESQTFNLDFSNTSVLGGRHILTYGANVRRNEFDLSIAPRGENRDDVGAFFQDEILFGDRVRWLVGGRWDDLDPVGVVLSPRSSLLVSATPQHTFRLSFNRAFRSPSLIENFLDIRVFNTLPLPALPQFGLEMPLDFLFGTDVMGYSVLQEEKLSAFEVGYVATLGAGKSFTLSVYRNELTDGVDFFASSFYSSAAPPAGWPLPSFILDLPQLEGVLPRTFTYRNLDEVNNQGVEVSLDYSVSPTWSWFLNYSFQDEPDTANIVNLPPEHRLNLGARYNGQRFYAASNINFADDAFWTDVLAFRGETDAYTLVNLNLGVRLAGEKVTLSLLAQNLFDEAVQQHLFGDIIRRKVAAQLRIDF